MRSADAETFTPGARSIPSAGGATRASDTRLSWLSGDETDSLISHSRSRLSPNYSPRRHGDTETRRHGGGLVTLIAWRIDARQTGEIKIHHANCCLSPIRDRISKAPPCLCVSVVNRLLHSA